MYTFALTVYVGVCGVFGLLHKGHCWGNWRHPGFPFSHIFCIDYTVSLIIMQLICYIKDIVLHIALIVPFM